MIKTLLRYLLITVIFVNSTVIYSHAHEQQETDVYHLLYQYPFADLSSKYENKSMPGYEIFLQSLENFTQYPYYSYSKLMTCYNLLFWNDIFILMKSMNNETLYTFLLNDIENKLYNTTQKLRHIPYNTANIASAEWYFLAKKDIQDSEIQLLNAKELFIKKEVVSAIQTLQVVNFLLENAENLLKISIEKNKNSILDYNKTENTVKVIAREWIQLTELLIDYNFLITNNSIQSIRESINLSKELYQNESYYLSLMKTAESKAKIEYMYNLPSTINRSTTLETCQIVIAYVNSIMMKIYNDPKIDAPLAENNIELAKLHLQDAEKEGSDSGSITIATLSIQEALCAKEQALAVLDLKKAIEQDLTYIDLTKEINNFIDEAGLSYLLLSIVIVESILLCFLWFNRRKS